MSRPPCRPGALPMLALVWSLVLVGCGEEPITHPVPPRPIEITADGPISGASTDVKVPVPASTPDRPRPTGPVIDYGPPSGAAIDAARGRP